jgi:hypothetical protein
MKNFKNHIIALLGATFITTVGIAPSAEAAATITVVNLDGAGEGFNDPAAPDPDSTAGGNAGATLGAQRLLAFQHAANLWGAELESSVEVRVGARFDPQTCTATSTILGSAGPVTFSRDFTGAPRANTWYPVALANKLHGSDLVPAQDDIGATFNSAVGTTCPFPNVWYYGLNASPPGSKIDFVTVVSHELAHGLGFLTGVNLTTGEKLSGFDDAFMLHLENHSTGEAYPDMTDAERVTASTSTGNLDWTGPLVIGNSVGLTAGKLAPSGHVRMFAPNPAQPGSSVSHWDTVLTPNEQQEPSYTGPDHTVGLSRPALCDIGWCSGNPVDLYFLTDLSGSFTDDLPVFKAEAPVIIDSLAAQFDLKVGLGSFVDYPISPFGNSGFGDYAYQRNIDITSNIAAVKTVISGLTTRDGVDTPESQLPALYQAATGAGQDLSGVGFAGASIPAGQNANFRNGVEKLFILWTDAGFHLPGDPGDLAYPGPSFNDTVNAILALDPPKVLGIVPGGDADAIADVTDMAIATNAIAPAGGVDCDNDGTIDIPAGAAIVCPAGATGIGIGAAIEAVVEAALAPKPISISVQSSINLKKFGVIPAAILSTSEFDASTVNPAKVCLSPEPTPGTGDCTEAHNKGHLEDVSGDGLVDLVLHYNPDETGLVVGGTQACLTGKTFDDKSVEGCVTVKVIK